MLSCLEKLWVLILAMPSASAKRNRDEQAARKLWDSLPPIGYANPTLLSQRRIAPAIIVKAAYGLVFPRNRHRAVGKETGKTS